MTISIKASIFPSHGAIAQMGERLNGIQEVGGSIPPGSTNLQFQEIIHSNAAHLSGIFCLKKSNETNGYETPKKIPLLHLVQEVRPKAQKRPNTLSSSLLSVTF